MFRSIPYLKRYGRFHVGRYAGEGSLGSSAKYAMKTNYIIPFFIIHKGCPYQCVFCDQKSISGREMVSPSDIPARIEEYLSTMPAEGARIEVGFFGGSFTGLNAEAQEKFLIPVQRYIRSGRIRGIRLSTRPDLIDRERLRLLKAYNVVCIELGIQSMSDAVLKAAKRGHTALAAEKASKLILDWGFDLAHQMMVGLPRSTASKEYYTARRIKDMGAAAVRIYPLVVMENTELADEWEKGEYFPLTEDEALERSARLISFFEVNSIKVLRCGLHPSEALMEKKGMLAGPFHESFRSRAESRIFSIMLEKMASDKRCLGEGIGKVYYNPKDESALMGFGGGNNGKMVLISSKGKDLFEKGEDVPRGCFLVKTKSSSFVLDRGIIIEDSFGVIE